MQGNRRSGNASAAGSSKLWTVRWKEMPLAEYQEFQKAQAK